MSPRTRTALSSLLLAVSATLISPPRLFAQAPHVLTAADRQQIDSLIQRMTPEQKIDYIGGTGFAVRAVPELNLPALEMSDGPYGVRSNAGFPSTTYAAGIGLAATWDRALAMKVGEGIGRDARARGVHYMLGPGTNIYRSPRNGRNFEYFGEDPYLAGEMVIGYVTGMQTQGVSATVKHYLANNSEYLRHDSDSVVDERTLREIYLPAFEAAVKRGHVGGIMDSYNFINGIHATANGYFNTEIARKEWHFPGTVMSDWDATYSAIGAANGGLDIEMPTGKFMNKANLLPALQAGTVTQATIDDKVRHILTTAAMFGWLAPGYSQRDANVSVISSASNDTALQSAREAPVLLKNTGNLLPLSKSIRTLLVVGPAAYPGQPVGGGSAGVVPFHDISLVEGLQQVAPGVNVLYAAGLPTLSELAGRTVFSIDQAGTQPGLTHELFKTKDLTGPSTQAPATHINETGVGWDAISGDMEALMALFMKPAHPISQRYTGYFNAPAASTYLIAGTGAGEGNGDRVYIDGKLVIDDWLYVRAFEPHLSMPLAQGMHKVVVESWQEGPIGGKIRLAIVPQDSVVDPRVKEMASRADAVVVAAGYTTNRDANTESEGGDRTFDLPFGQDALIREMAARNAKTIVTVTSGGNVETAPWLGNVPAYLEAWYGGQAGGQALAEILFGDTNPSGHLPATFERRAEDNPTFANYYPEPGTNKILYKEGIFVGYRGYEKNHTEPLFPFGHGLSYTSFTFANLKVATVPGEHHMASVEFDLTNSGSRKGADVAQVYVSEEHPKIARPAHELKGFERAELNPGETRHITIQLDPRAFAYYNVGAKRWTIDAGKFKVSVGDSLAVLPLIGTVDLKESAILAAEPDLQN